MSTEQQADSGLSLSAQREKLRTWVSLYDAVLVDTVVDAGVSGKSIDRPGLSSALKRLRNGEADALLVAKLDRLTRSVRDLGALVDEVFAKGPGLISVAESIDTRTASGRLVLNVLGAVSQWEREAIGERTAEAMAQKAARGEYVGGQVPYGFQLRSDGVRLKLDRAEQAVIREAQRLQAKGLSLRAVADALDSNGYRSRTGVRFGPKQVRSMTYGAS